MEFLVVLAAAALRVATPILLAALGEMLAERAGVLNLGIEGTMLLAAFVGFVAAHQSGSLWVGLAAAVATGALMGALMALLSVTLGLNQHVSGLGITLLGGGLALYFFRLLYGGASTPPSLGQSFGQLSVLPGTTLAPLLSQYGLTYFALLLVPVLALVLRRTAFGLRLHASGENPEAVDIAGVNVYRVRYQALVLGGALMGLAGAFLTLAQLGAFTHGVVNGRGWVAIAIVIFGNWRPVRILLGALLFGFVQALQLRLQAEGVALPYEILLALPYLVTILVLALAGRNASYPAALLKPYRREGG
ncbi:MAG TPA: ABC transporter permease [Trueperaceae bacterium]|nr:ABC transporter permease [Trueperaceae bacterium]